MTNYLVHAQKRTFDLPHDTQCSLVGITSGGLVYVEEFVEEWIVRHALTLTGDISATWDEREGALPALPEDLISVRSPSATLDLNVSGARLRGIRQTERIDDLVQPLTIHEKMALVDRLGLRVPPPLVIGLAESAVLSEALLVPPSTYVVCRRLRIAHALMSARQDEDGDTYDYDTATLHIAHIYDGEPVDLDSALTDLPDLHAPMDCLVYEGRLIIADSGLGAVVVWDIQNDTPDSS